MAKKGKDNVDDTAGIVEAPVSIVTPTKPPKPGSAPINNADVDFTCVHAVFFASNNILIRKPSSLECQTLVDGLGSSAAGLGVEIKTFKDDDEFIKFKDGLMSSASTKPQGTKYDASFETKTHSPSKETGLGPQPIEMKKRKATGSIEKNRRSHNIDDDITDDIPDYKLSENHDTPGNENSQGFKDTITSPLALKYRQHIPRRGINMIVHTFPTVPTSATIQPILIDFVDQKSWTHWCHRATWWRDVIQYAYKEGVDLNKFLGRIRSIYGTTKNSCDTIETNTIKSSTGNNITLQRQLLIGYIRNGLADEDILKTLEKLLQPIYANKDVRQCYFVSVTGTTENKNLMRALDPSTVALNDSYWAMLEGAIREHRVIHKHTALNEVCLSNDMINIIKTVAQDPELKDSQILKKEMNEELKKFAYGE